ATQMTRFADPLIDAFAAAGQAAGYRTTADYNGAQQEGFGIWQMTVRDGRRAAGVEYVKYGRTVTAHAAREVILCGGVINAPHLLMLSGIGDPDELRAHGIAVVVALPGVGKNLQDHISASIAYRRKERGPFHRAMRLDRIVPALAAAYLH